MLFDGWFRFVLVNMTVLGSEMLSIHLLIEKKNKKNDNLVVNIQNPFGVDP